MSLTEKMLLILCISLVTAMGAIGVADRLGEPEEEEDLQPECLRPSAGEVAPKTYPWAKAVDRGFVTRRELQALKDSGWVHKASIGAHSGGYSWDRIAIPVKEDREAYFQETYPPTTIRVVLMESNPTSMIRSRGLVLEVEAGYGPLHFEEIDVDMAYEAVRKRFLIEWGR